MAHGIPRQAIREVHAGNHRVRSHGGCAAETHNRRIVADTNDHPGILALPREVPLNHPEFVRAHGFAVTIHALRLSTCFAARSSTALTNR